MTAKKRIAILASGGGSNAAALMKAMQDPGFPAEAVMVFSNVPGAGVLQKAKDFGVPTWAFSHKAFAGREAFDQAVLELLAEAKPDYVCLAGYLRILTPAFVRAYAGRILNIHPALLPKFGGPGMHGHHVHEAVLAAGEKESGATVHFVDEGVDSGAIVLQQKVPVLAGDTAESLAARVLGAEHQVYAAALKQLCSRA
ncbi:MAG TPA: phosphoribosylglycinamide formyltransferase [bacterium]|nr:phosphoribosylglycinamide formyltransferase [bacterium]HXB96765.1 phosphoribosylglycinamide formyltransferase [bacterium]